MYTETFIRQASAVGAECRLVPGAPGLIACLAALLGEAGVSDSPGQYAVLDPGALDSLPLSAAGLPAIPGLRLDATRETAANALAGITAAGYGIAETGSLLCDSSPAAYRLATTLPQIHIALLRSSRIVPSMAEALALIPPSTARFIAAITGPSRTADIERVLTIGVHGPKRLIILILDDGSAGEPQP